MEQRVRFCGIDFGSQNLKLVCRLDTPVRESDFLIREGPAPGSLVDLCEDANTLGTALASLRVQAGLGLRGISAAVSMPTSAMVVKAVNLPPLNHRERQAAFQMELERFMTRGDRDVVGDYLPLVVDPDEAGSQEGYLLMATWQRLINVLRTVLKVAHVRTEAIEPEPVTLFRLLRMLAPRRGEGAYVLVDLGAAGTRVLVEQRGQLLLFRDLAVGGAHLTDVIARAHGLDWNEAESYKCSRLQSAVEIPELTAEAERLEKEIERSLRYVERQRGLEGYSGLYLVGGGAAWPFLRRVVERAVGMPARDDLVLGDELVSSSTAQAAALALYHQVIPDSMPAQPVGRLRRPAEGGLGQ